MSVKQPTANNVISLQCKIFSFGPIKKFPSFKHDSLCAREIKLNPQKKTQQNKFTHGIHNWKNNITYVQHKWKFS